MAHRNFVECNDVNYIPSNIKVFPEPSFPQIRDNSPGGNLTDTSINENFRLGVDDRDVTPLLVPVLVMVLDDLS